jgi:hypothetical protein
VDDAPDESIAEAPAIPWPSVAIRNDLDAKILAVLWAVRKAWLPLLWFGSSLAVVYFIIVHDPQASSDRFAEASSPGELLTSRWSPSLSR